MKIVRKNKTILQTRLYTQDLKNTNVCYCVYVKITKALHFKTVKKYEKN